MRLYLTEEIEGRLLVVAEVIGRRDPVDGQEIPHSIAEGHCMTRDELLDVRGGRQAIWDWERGDDSAYAAGREAFMRECDAEEIRELGDWRPRIV